MIEELFYLAGNSEEKDEIMQIFKYCVSEKNMPGYAKSELC